MRFEDAADAIIAGDVPKLRELLSAHPELIHERSTRGHHAPLLHFISANGVEGYRQITPPNIVEVAKVLLDAGAEVDAESEAYGGGSKALGLVATSAHPRRAGVQIPLIDLLLEHGAAMDGEDVRSALANGCPEAAKALVERGARVDTVVEAAAVCPLDVVKRMAAGATRKDLEKALAKAAAYGSYDVLEYLLGLGVDVAAPSGMSPLHQAAGRANLEMVKLLIERGAPLEMKNFYGRDRARQHAVVCVPRQSRGIRESRLSSGDRCTHRRGSQDGSLPGDGDSTLTRSIERLGRSGAPDGGAPYESHHRFLAAASTRE